MCTYINFAVLVVLACSITADENVNSKATMSEGSLISESAVTDHDQKLLPTVMVYFAARNKAHVLPYFLSLLTSLDYPKNRISLWIRSDHNSDETSNIIQIWLEEVQKDYHSVNFTTESDPKSFANEQSKTDWPAERFRHIIKLKEEALSASKSIWADYVWFLDCDVLLTEKSTLKDLVKQKKTVIAPMLSTFRTFSNFWCGMDEHYYYKRTNEYLPIQSRKNIGVHNVVLVQAAVLIDLRFENSQLLSFDPHKLANITCPYDDIIAFSLSAKTLGVEMFVSNEKKFGYLPVPLDKDEVLQVEIDRITDFKLDVIANGKPIEVLPYLETFLVQKGQDNMNFDQMYLINLERRHERRKNMQAAFQEIGFDVKVFEAVDGKKLNFTYLEQQQIVQLPGYLDPYNDREMKLGEIGCFLSHYRIWQDIVSNNYQRVIIFEDDVKFHEAFRENFKVALEEAEKIDENWDLIYLGRKIMQSGESYMPGANKLVNISYSHWTIAYALTYSGAKKLLDEDPLAKLVPADEYLPIMYNRHPRSEWMSQFDKRDLRAYGIHPTLVEPTHYLGDPGYITDTENSEITEFKKGDSNPAKDEL